MLDLLMGYLQYPFVQKALVAGVFISVCTGLLGVVLVLRRFSLIGDGLSHVAFATSAVALVTNAMSNLFISIAVTIVFSILLLRRNSKLSGDAAIAILSVGSLSFGYLLINLFSKSANKAADVCSFLFGATSILTLTDVDVVVSVIMSVLVCVLFVVYYNKIFAITFDSVFAETAGTRVSTYDVAVACIVAIIIVLAMDLVGALLVSALIIFPALSSMRVLYNFRAVCIMSVVIAVTASLAGLLVAVCVGTPVGSTIVGVEVIVYVICYLISLVKGG